MDNGAGSSGSITGGAVCEAVAGLGEVVLMGDISMLREAGGRRSVKSRDFVDLSIKRRVSEKPVFLT